MTRVEALETCLRQVADDMDTAVKFLRMVDADGVQMAEMLEQSAAAARETATDNGDGQ